MKNIQFLFFLVSFLLVGCGAGEQMSVKQYNLFFKTKDRDLEKMLEKFAARFNTEAGIQVLNIVDDVNAANSVVSFRKGVEVKEGKLGYGQAVYRTVSEAVSPSMEVPGATTYYSMALEFDYDFMKVRSRLNDGDPEYERAVLLFYHEAGHGLTFDHASKDDERSVMYPWINSAENIDYESFFLDVNSFMSE